MAEVVRLTGTGPILGNEPPKYVVEMLEELLARAKRGEIKGFGYFVVDGADGTETSFVQGCAEQHIVISAVSRLWFCMMKMAAE